MTHDQVLFWLNDHCGENVHAEVQVERGDQAFTVLAADGILRHWRGGDPLIAEGWEAHPREDILGWYSVGETSLDLTYAPIDADVWSGGDGFTLELAEDVSLSVVVPMELGAD